MSDITLTFPDGASRAYAKGITGKALAESIAKTLARRAVAMVLDGRIADLADPITADAMMPHTSWPRRCRRYGPAPRSPSGR